MKKLKTILPLVLLLVVISLWAVYYTNNVETKTMDDTVRKNVTGKFVALSAGITHYEEAGAGADTAQTIILVHGYSVPAYIWNSVYDNLEKEGFHVIKYDEFGRGYSDRPDVDYTPEFYRQQLLDLIKALKIKTPIALAGLSFGGAVVGDFVVNNPALVNKVILIDPVFNFSKAGYGEFINNYMMTLEHEKRANGQLEDFKYPQNFPDWATKYKPQMQYKGFRHSLISTNANYSGKTIKDNYKALNALHKKVLLIWGKEDQTVTFNFSDSLRQLLEVRFLPVEDVGHLPHLEQPTLVNAAIVSFLREKNQ